MDNADAAGSGADVALSMNVVTWNAAIAGGGVVDGMLLSSWGVASFSESFSGSLVILLGIALIIAWAARSHAFKTER